MPTRLSRAHASYMSWGSFLRYVWGSSLRVGTVLRLAAGEPVRVDRTFAHPTIFYDLLT